MNGPTSREGLGGPRADSLCENAISVSLVGWYNQAEYVSVPVLGLLVGSALTAVVAFLELVDMLVACVGGVDMTTVINFMAAGASGRRAAVGV